MPPDALPDSPDVLELQKVLTRYVDSQEGYEQAAKLMDREDHAAAFSEVAARRRVVGDKVATLLESKGEEADDEGSVEGVLHRWWIRLREKMAHEELQPVLSECIRGEKSLLDSLNKALESEEHSEEFTQVLRDAAAEVRMAIDHFEAALDS